MSDGDEFRVKAPTLGSSQFLKQFEDEYKVLTSTSFFNFSEIQDGATEILLPIEYHVNQLNCNFSLLQALS